MVKYSMALLNAISAWEASYKKEVQAAGGPAAFGHAREKSSELHMERFKVWRCYCDPFAKRMLHFIEAHANSCSWALALMVGWPQQLKIISSGRSVASATSGMDLVYGQCLLQQADPIPMA
jgi:hypothetical protein